MKRNRTAGYLLAFFLGFIGIHAIYYKKYVRGIVYALISIFFDPLIPLMVIIGWIDMFFIKKWDRQLNEHGTPKISFRKDDQFNPASLKPKEVKSQTIKKKRSLFYNEEDHILDKYAHLTTSKHINDTVQEVLKEGRTSESGISISYATNGTTFLKDSYKYRNKSRHKPTREIPLKEYWTTFRSLNERQLDWYFYWRTQVLNKNYPDADLSYIILFVYELMNYSFNKNAAFNISVMETLYEQYKNRQPKLSNYLPQWIADMLFELNEVNLAKRWDAPTEEIPRLYTILEEKFPLEEVSMTTWNRYIQYGRKSAFFNENRAKIYKVFKESIGILESYYDTTDESLIKKWFEKTDMRNVRQLFISAVIGRDFDAVHVPVTNYDTTDDLNDQVSNVMKYAENICREMNGVSYRIKVNEGVLPDELKDLIKQNFLSKKTVNGDTNNNKIVKEERFKVVSKSGDSQSGEGSQIPKLASDDSGTEPLDMQTFFDASRIDKLTKETDELVSSFSNETVTNEVTGSRTEEEQTLTEAALNINNLFSSEVMEDDYHEFIKTLNDEQMNFIRLFSKTSDYKISHEKATKFVQGSNMMLGVFLAEFNSKADEYLGDVLFESSSDSIDMLPEFVAVIEMVEEGVGHAN